MNEQQVFNSDLQATDKWLCGKCSTSGTKESAAACCLPRNCKCGVQLDRYEVECNKCWRKEFERKTQEKLDQAEIVEHDGWVYVEGLGVDGYFQSVDDLVEYCHDFEHEVPEFAHICTDNRIEFDVSYIYDYFQDEGYEDIGDNLIGCKELEEAIDKFNADNAKVAIVYYPDTKKKVRVVDAR